MVMPHFLHHFIHNNLITLIVDWCEKKEELRVQGPGVNEVSFRARPHHNVHRTLGCEKY
jgi:hypothetical protein